MAKEYDWDKPAAPYDGDPPGAPAEHYHENDPTGKAYFALLKEAAKAS